MLKRAMNFLKEMKMPSLQSPIAKLAIVVPKPVKLLVAAKSKVRREATDSDGKIRRQKHMVESNRLI
ncbi:hypothetical protein HB779_09060 [Phyllobacterium sp. 628]|uniref:hypothetical protein n=1 Tax=Phyllobacterium sp. 628 TaxID=2718938 RepID=UPI0016622371|nr:hypothetical protein [Phyllobacterium sp. 628]QND52042.1 hypothetical protein HB779_09060 [Phyllobacterium sp. 628]